MLNADAVRQNDVEVNCKRNTHIHLLVNNSKLYSRDNDRHKHCYTTHKFRHSDDRVMTRLGYMAYNVNVVSLYHVNVSLITVYAETTSARLLVYEMSVVILTCSKFSRHNDAIEQNFCLSEIAIVLQTCETVY